MSNQAKLENKKYKKWGIKEFKNWMPIFTRKIKPIFTPLLEQRGINKFYIIDSIPEGNPYDDGIEPQSGILVTNNKQIYNFYFLRKNREDQNSYYFYKFKEIKIPQEGFLYEAYLYAMKKLK